MNCFVSLPNVVTLNKSPFSASYSHLTLELVCYEWAACLLILGPGIDAHKL